MNQLFEKLILNYPYVIAAVLFTIGAITVLTRSSLFKKLIGVNIMESAIFLLFVSSAYIRRAKVPMHMEGVEKAVHVNPLPSALMLTGIVVSVSVTAFALALMIRLHQSYRTTNLKIIEEKKGEVQKND
ncbi:MAG: cation:proton antiporter subunit C [Oscillospiraceae bacterium]|nr:cation:proton antiporter subunit C [Oscillospiraceae bacterium]